MEKCSISKWLPVIVFIAGVSLGWAEEEREADPILQFYCVQAGTACDKLSPAKQALTYSFTAFSYLKKIGTKGAVTHVDSAVAYFYFSGGLLDSQVVAASTSSQLGSLDFSYPNVFSLDYRYNFYPNDTGGWLAIGFDSDSSGDPRPVGLAFIDRNNYSLHRLYLFYPNKAGYRRYSRTLLFREYKGYIFPDTILEVGARMGVFSTDNYRLETVISNIRISR